MTIYACLSVLDHLLRAGSLSEGDCPGMAALFMSGADVVLRK